MHGTSEGVASEEKGKKRPRRKYRAQLLTIAF